MGVITKCVAARKLKSKLNRVHSIVKFQNYRPFFLYISTFEFSQELFDLILSTKTNETIPQ